MEINRRKMLQGGSLATLALSWGGIATGRGVVEAAGYDGPGLYLYPAWGDPALYLVTAAQDLLEFRDPHSSALLWRQSPALGADFAGKLAVL